ncbi:hypothetical protein HA052_04485 [Chromobacterium haemolyticum]|uniref:Uncharacterized protein n=1 Tax=Chromobacterium fluminis TaxID=3044269 RepID=A0ABX0L0I3_9NEIS|nr:hypothetical protein [Chromobacterium haemolyticum]NHR04448.1 hypothetical protein [Chromobacterium haemolyticum]
MTLENLKLAVKVVKKDEDVSALAQAFGLQPEDRSGKREQILSIHSGVVEGIQVSVSHRWYDRSKPFSIQPDGNKVELFVDGKIVAVGSFEDEA